MKMGEGKKDGERERKDEDIYTFLTKE